MRQSRLADFSAWFWGSAASAQFARFLVVGLINVIFGQVVFSLLILAGTHYLPALLLATLAGILFNFQTYGNLVFGSRDPRLLAKFFLGYAVVFALNAVALSDMVDVGVEPIRAQAMLILPLAFLSFLINRTLVFRVAKPQ